MKRKLELIDVMVSIGMVATLIGAYAFFQVSDGAAVSFTPATNQMAHPTMTVLVQAKLQPAMGQAIVDRARLEQQFASDISRGTAKLASAIRAGERQPHGGLDKIEKRAAQMEADHRARVQYVMGRSTVILTKQGMRAGALSADNLENGVNERIIARRSRKGQKYGAGLYEGLATTLGRWIVEAARQEGRYDGHIQERIGRATVDLASIQHAYHVQRASLQNQFNALTAAAARIEPQPDSFARLPKADPNWQYALSISKIPQLDVMKAGTGPEIPVYYVMAATVGLVTMFFLGLSIPREGRKSEARATWIEGRKQDRYRKAV